MPNRPHRRVQHVIADFSDGSTGGTQLFPEKLLSSIAPTDEVSLTRTNAPGRPWILLAVVGFALVILAAIRVLVVGPRVP
jgi:hypothetical protein